jgi:hypothetical protein
MTDYCVLDPIGASWKDGECFPGNKVDSYQLNSALMLRFLRRIDESRSTPEDKEKHNLYADIHREELAIGKYIVNEELTVVKKFTTVATEILDTE